MDSGWVRKGEYAPSAASGSAWGRVTPLPFVGPDEELVEALRKGHPGAAKAFYDRYADVVDRVLFRVLGGDDALPDLIEASFLRAIAGVGRLRDPARLQTWVASAAVMVARAHLRRRARARLAARWRGVRPDAEVDVGPGTPRAADTVGRAMLSVYDVLDALPVDERIVFALRVID